MHISHANSFEVIDKWKIHFVKSIASTEFCIRPLKRSMEFFFLCVIFIAITIVVIDSELQSSTYSSSPNDFSPPNLHRHRNLVEWSALLFSCMEFAHCHCHSTHWLRTFWSFLHLWVSGEWDPSDILSLATRHINGPGECIFSVSARSMQSAFFSYPPNTTSCLSWFSQMHQTYDDKRRVRLLCNARWMERGWTVRKKRKHKSQPKLFSYAIELFNWFTLFEHKSTHKHTKGIWWLHWFTCKRFTGVSQIRITSVSYSVTMHLAYKSQHTA